MTSEPAILDIRQRAIALIAQPLWLYVLLAAGVMVFSGLVQLSGSDDSVVAILSRTRHVLVFLVAITIVADLCSTAGFFDAVGMVIARCSAGHTGRLYVGICVAGLVTTSIMSLDTTAVLLTPVVLRLAKNLDLRPTAFAMAAIWLANAGSLMLPVSNLTNLLAMYRLNVDPWTYFSIMWIPACVAVAVPVSLLALQHRRTLCGRFARTPDRPPSDIVLTWACGAVIAMMIPALGGGLPVDIIAVAAVLLLLPFFLIRRRGAFGWHLLPWRLVVLTVGLFIAMAGLSKLGAGSLVSAMIGNSDSFMGLLRTAVGAAIAANLFNNLPAYLLVEHAIATDANKQLLSALIGVNAGPGILLHGSLATLLWLDRCKKENVEISGIYFAAFGMVAVPLTLVASTVSLWAVLR